MNSEGGKSDIMGRMEDEEIYTQNHARIGSARTEEEATVEYNNSSVCGAIVIRIRRQVKRQQSGRKTKSASLKSVLISIIIVRAFFPIMGIVSLVVKILQLHCPSLPSTLDESVLS